MFSLAYHKHQMSNVAFEREKKGGINHKIVKKDQQMLNFQKKKERKKFAYFPHQFSYFV